MLEWGNARTTAATISGMSFLVKESVPLCRLAGDAVEAEDEVLLLFLLGPEAEPVELVEAEPGEQVEEPRRGVLRVDRCAGGSVRLACVRRVD